MANLQIRIDDSLKAEAQKVAEAMGMEVATAVRIFLCQMVRDKAFPFTPSMKPEPAPVAPLPPDRENWLRQAVHTGLEALTVKDYASDEDMKDIFRKAGANVG